MIKLELNSGMGLKKPKNSKYLRVIKSIKYYLNMIELIELRSPINESLIIWNRVIV